MHCIATADSVSGGLRDDKGIQRGLEKDEDGYFVASVPALRGCHTQAKSLDVLMKRIREAVELCLEVEGPVSIGRTGGMRLVVG